MSSSKSTTLNNLTSAHVSVVDPAEVSTSNETPYDGHNCPQCGCRLFCGVSLGQNECWCFDVDIKKTASVTTKNSLCLCPDCLHNAPAQYGDK
ncbi:cysteine-rich CWC family protein [Vibrio ulleungensis]|uniref:Cysteine-rich CWC family protein n=1 Tax=Vibrio ulleungensis TaxID=2807619 RepID=A0ABS2HD75_9VIBR|nr:cysteine-rich CWC family protein [Vibrio ulleungensis]